MKTKKGFTLVELLVVIAILAILATATIVGFTAFTQKAKQSNLEGELKQVTELLQLEDYYNTNFEIRDGKIYGTSDTELNTDGLRAAIASGQDAELKSYSARLTYQNGVLSLSDGNSPVELQAWWTISSNTIESGKVTVNP